MGLGLGPENRRRDQIRQAGIGLEELAIDHVRYIRNDQVLTGSACPAEVSEVLPESARLSARATIAGWEGYQPTRLYSLNRFAVDLGLKAVCYKDESSRFELASFKSLGGAYAVQKVLQRKISQLTDAQVTLEDVEERRHSELASAITVVAATDGNHGRSVAWGARRFGCRCVIYMHEQVSPGRQQAVEAFGARVERVVGNYDDSVHAAASAARENDWIVVSDTSWPGYESIPREVMAGYALMSSESMEQWPFEEAPTHVFIQGGCGGMAAAICIDLWDRTGAEKPVIVVVEPEPAACLYESACAGGIARVDITTESVMAGLSCGEVSVLAWPVLQQSVDAFLTISDDQVGTLMSRLAKEESIVAGESAVAGLAGLMAACGNDQLTRDLDLSPSSRILLFGTEGATDPEIYRQLVG